MPRIAVKSVCKCGAVKPSHAKFCDDCAPKENTQSWDVKNKRQLAEYGTNPYMTTAYKHARNFAVRRDSGLCQPCLVEGKYTSYDHVDHIIPISAGGEFNDPENLQCICEACHKVKTAKEARRK